MIGFADSLVQGREVDSLRTRLAQVRRELTETTTAYRTALAHHDSAQTIPLLRSRSRLMRQLLETQCELLLAFRSEATEMAPQASQAEQAVQH